jgi:uncharacterized protein YigE (DUF2233 family)
MKASAMGVLLAVLALSACRNEVAKPVTGPPACKSETFEGAAFVDCVATRTDGELRLYTAGPDGVPLRSLAALKSMLGAEAAQVRFATNAGMFDTEGRPIGLYIAAGQVVKPLNRNRGPGNFHLMPNGVFSVEADGFHIRTTDAFVQIAAGTALIATQSGPMIVIDGKLHPRISRDGTSLNIRNAVGVDRSGKAHFVISDDPVSFGKIARYLRDAKDCPNALFLDGTVSSLWDPGGGRMDAGAPLGPMIVSVAANEHR